MNKISVKEIISLTDRNTSQLACQKNKSIQFVIFTQGLEVWTFGNFWQFRLEATTF